MSESRLLEKIAGLLAKAESTDSEAEAAALFDKAQQLSTLYSIDLAKARAHTADKNKVATPVRQTVVVGEKGTKGLRTYTDLFLGIAQANDLRCLISHDATRVYVHGFAEDVSASEALFAALVVHMASATSAFKKTGDWKFDTVGDFPWNQKPISWLRARLDFQHAYAGRISTRLRLAKMDAETQALNDEVVAKTSTSTSTELVLADKRAEVDVFYKDYSRLARGSYRGSSSSGAPTSSQAGRSAANNARLSGQGSFGGARKAVNA